MYKYWANSPQVQNRVEQAGLVTSFTQGLENLQRLQKLEGLEKLQGLGLVGDFSFHDCQGRRSPEKEVGLRGVLQGVER